MAKIQPQVAMFPSTLAIIKEVFVKKNWYSICDAKVLISIGMIFLS
jgi:hypothetical protein